MSAQNNISKNFFAHPTVALDDNVTIGENSKIWHFSHILGNTVIGANCNLGQNVVVGPDVTIADGCKIQNNVSIYKGVTLEEDVFCGPSMVFTNVFNPRAHIKRMNEVRPTLVKKGASLGANSTIVCGVTIGKYSFIGAGAVVTKDVPDYALMLGNPARQTGWICECGEKLDKSLRCTVCKKSLVQDNTAPIAFVDLAAQQQRILPEIEKNIKFVLKHGKYIMGPEVRELETKLAHFVKVKHAIACSSGTDALLMALMAYDIGPGDAVFTTPFTFVATAEVVKLLGAVPVFVDIDQRTFNISSKKLKATIEGVRQDGRLNPKAVIPVDLFGLPSDYDEISDILSNYDLVIIEDAAQSMGGEYKGRMAGSLGNVGCTSFFPAKPLGCYGDGGAVFTDSNDIAEKLRSICVHGKGRHKYENIRIGLNGRLDTIQAAILLAKLEIFSEEIDKRQKVAETYDHLLCEVKNITLPYVESGYKSAWAQYSILAADNEGRERICNQLRQNGIPTAIYYPKPLHIQKAFRDLNHKLGDFPVSEDVASRIFSLPMHPYLSSEDQKKIVSAFNS